MWRLRVALHYDKLDIRIINGILRTWIRSQNSKWLIRFENKIKYMFFNHILSAIEVIPMTSKKWLFHWSPSCPQNYTVLPPGYILCKIFGTIISGSWILSRVCSSWSRAQEWKNMNILKFYVKLHVQYVRKFLHGVIFCNIIIIIFR